MVHSIVTFVVKGFHPLSFVEDEHFINILQVARPGIQMPSSDFLRDVLIPQRSDDAKSELFDLMAKAAHVCLTVDMWSSPTVGLFLGITGHFVVGSHLKSGTLLCHRLQGQQHTPASIGQLFGTVLENFNIQNKVSFVVTDNASRVIDPLCLFPRLHVDGGCENEESGGCDLEVVSVEEMIVDLAPEKLPCFTDALQMVLRDAIDADESIKSLLDKARELLAFCLKSPLAKAVLNEVPKRRPEQPIPHWTDQLKMLLSILNIPEDVLAEQCPIQLSECELVNIQELGELFAHFEEVLERCLSKKSGASSCVIPCVRGLRHTMEGEMDLAENETFLPALRASLESRLAKFEEMECFQMAAALDPRFKLDWCNDEEEVETVKGLLTAKLCEVLPKLPASEAPSRKRPRLFSYMDTDRAEPISVATRILAMYLCTPCLGVESNPFEFWQDRTDKLALLARKYLSIPVSPVCVEKIFSAAGKLFRQERCDYSEKTLDEILTIVCNS